jgi:DNA invertase Pin-like site-specific DNA recombinase
MKPVVYYIRTSTQEQQPDLQIRDIDTICEVEYDLYREQESAWAENVTRPVFDSIINHIKKRKITNLYVWDLDRIYRNRKRLQEFFILCKTYNCKVHSYRQNWLEDINSIPHPFNEIVFDLLISITGWLSQDDSNKKSQRIKMAVVKRINGTFSYKGNKWGRKALPKQTIERVLDFHQQGKSIREIASLVKIYDKHNNGKQISKSAVHKIIVSKAQQNDSIYVCT